MFAEGSARVKEHHSARGVIHPLPTLSLVAVCAPWCLRAVWSVWQVKFSLLM